MKTIKLISVVILLFSCQRINEIHKREIKLQSFRGIIIKNFQDSSNHMVYTFIIKTDQSTFEYGAQDLQQIWKYAKVGDSIIKLTDSLKLTIKNESGTKSFYYEDYK